MHAEKKFANSRLLFSLPTMLYKMAVQLKGFPNPIMFGNAYQQISFLGTSHVAISFGIRSITVVPVVPLVGEE